MSKSCFLIISFYLEKPSEERTTVEFIKGCLCENQTFQFDQIISYMTAKLHEIKAYAGCLPGEGETGATCTFLPFSGRNIKNEELETARRLTKKDVREMTVSELSFHGEPRAC